MLLAQGISQAGLLLGVPVFFLRPFFRGSYPSLFKAFFRRSYLSFFVWVPILV